MKKVIFSSLMVAGMSLFNSSAMANIYTVTNTNDSGAGSLRQAILNANANPGPDTIVFLISTGGGNLFEGSGVNTYAVIQINSELPVINGDLLIDGTSQTNTNTGSVSAQNVGVDNIALANIALPDIYIVPSAAFPFPATPTGTSGNGISIDGTNVTIKGIAISGFGNTSTNGGNASGHSDIAVLRSATARTANVVITECFISCDPMGNFPADAQRRSKGNGLLILGNNETGSITNNYISYSGTYGIHFNGNTDNNGVGPLSTTLGNRNWTISGNRIISTASNSTISALTRVNDGITMMKCALFDVTYNYIRDAEQTGIDLGYNSDSNFIANNTVTGFARTNALAPMAGIRIGLCSEGDTLSRNLIFDNTSANFRAGIWIDESTLTQTGVITKANINHYISENTIHDNTGSGVVLSNNSTGSCYNIKISRNLIYNHSGLGIDLNFNGTSGSPLVTYNDDGDVDAGPNNLVNFPMLDSVKNLGNNLYAFYGKCRPGAVLEFFITDGGLNNHGGSMLNYGEGRYYIGTAVEGSELDQANETDVYDIDGNVANTSPDNLFQVVLEYTGTLAVGTGIAATATIADNTSEFGPSVNVVATLACDLLSFNGNLQNNQVNLKWSAVSDEEFLYFEVQHSINGKDFKTIGKVYPNQHGAVAWYSFQHTVQHERNFYRLRMVNMANKTAYSGILSLGGVESLQEPLQVNTLFNGQIEMNFLSTSAENLEIQLFDLQGRSLLETNHAASKGTNFIRLTDTHKLQKGMYILTIKTSDKTYSKKLIKA